MCYTFYLWKVQRCHFKMYNSSNKIYRPLGIHFLLPKKCSTRKGIMLGQKLYIWTGTSSTEYYHEQFTTLLRRQLKGKQKSDGNKSFTSFKYIIKCCSTLNHLTSALGDEWTTQMTSVSSPSWVWMNVSSCSISGWSVKKYDHFYCGIYYIS